ncbi:MAG TPA: hypothetical protein VHP13_00245 [Gammaproteobacteria bacterium]|jgi:hypothetical protein|nr:hypothetical protein [Gammaproteobacteria bacterium]
MNETPAKAKSVRRLLSSGIPGADYGVFLLATPVIGAIGILITAFASYSLTGFIWLVALTFVVTAIMAVLEIVQAPAAWDPDPPTQAIARWAALLTFAWPAGYPLYLKERKRWKLDDWMKAALAVDALFVAAAVAGAVVTVTGYAKAPPSAEQKEVEPALLTSDPHWIPDPDDIYIVKTGHLDNCPRRTLDQEVSGYFESPRWEAGATSDGTDFVNVSGILTYQDRPAVAVLQFVMYKDKSGFRPHLFTINGVPQPLYVTAFTLAQMCEM